MLKIKQNESKIITNERKNAVIKMKVSERRRNKRAVEREERRRK